MKKEVIWHALFSQSGSEILEISNRVARLPDSIITNRSLENIHKINPVLLERAFDRFVFLPRVPTVEEYTTALKHANFVTLHGFLRVIPADICFRYNIFNGHPGLITKYPALKGKDPQARVWNSKEKYLYHGHVIHKVVATVDDGEILSSAYFTSEDLKADFKDLEAYIKQLHNVSINNWVAFMKKRAIFKQ